MNHPASISATLTTQPAQSEQPDRPIGLWALAAALVVIVVGVLLADVSLSSEQRIAALMQSGIFP